MRNLTELADVEPRYQALLDAERADWRTEATFQEWRNLYISEYARGAYILDTLRQYADFIPEGKEILDIGCGDAGAAIYFAKAGAEAHGIEPHQKSLARGKVRAEEHGVDIDLRGDRGEELPYPDRSFDLIVLDNVLEHVADQRRTLQEIRRVLRDGGLLYMVTPKPFTPHSIISDPHYGLAGLVLMPRPMQIWYYERVRGGGIGSYDVGHIPTRRQAQKLLEQEGFESLTDPRDLWIHYLRERLRDPEAIRPGLKRTLAHYLNTRDWPFTCPLLRWFWDVTTGSNFFLARRPPPTTSRPPSGYRPSARPGDG
jgi:ubiquinone/menaquinone biosynthesis C-methylase UbiE